MTCMVRRSRELSGELHPGLSLVGYTLLTQIDAMSQAHAADLAAYFGLDKSTVSRQLDELINAGLLRRDGERPGRRGQALVVTDEGAGNCAKRRTACVPAWPSGWPTGTTRTSPASPAW